MYVNSSSLSVLRCSSAGQKTPEIIIDTLQAFGRALKVVIIDHWEYSFCLICNIFLKCVFPLWPSRQWSSALMPKYKLPKFSRKVVICKEGIILPMANSFVFFSVRIDHCKKEL